jgi:hypothetical protein
LKCLKIHYTLQGNTVIGQQTLHRVLRFLTSHYILHWLEYRVYISFGDLCFVITPCLGMQLLDNRLYTVFGDFWWVVTPCWGMQWLDNRLYTEFVNVWVFIIPCRGIHWLDSRLYTEIVYFWIVITPCRGMQWLDNCNEVRLLFEESQTEMQRVGYSW